MTLYGLCLYDSLSKSKQAEQFRKTAGASVCGLCVLS